MIPHENRVILRLLCAIHCFLFPELLYVLLFLPDFVSKSLSNNSIEVNRIGYETDCWKFFSFFCPKARNLSSYPAIGTILSNEIYCTRIGSGIVDRIPGNVTSILQSTVYTESRLRSHYTFSNVRSTTYEAQNVRDIRLTYKYVSFIFVFYFFVFSDFLSRHFFLFSVFNFKYENEQTPSLL